MLRKKEKQNKKIHKPSAILFVVVNGDRWREVDRGVTFAQR